MLGNCQWIDIIVSCLYVHCFNASKQAQSLFTNHKIFICSKCVSCLCLGSTGSRLQIQFVTLRSWSRQLSSQSGDQDQDRLGNPSDRVSCAWPLFSAIKVSLGVWDLELETKVRVDFTILLGPSPCWKRISTFSIFLTLPYVRQVIRDWLA